MEGKDSDVGKEHFPLRPQKRGCSDVVEQRKLYIDTKRLPRSSCVGLLTTAFSVRARGKFTDASRHLHSDTRTPTRLNSVRAEHSQS